MKRIYCMIDCMIGAAVILSACGNSGAISESPSVETETAVTVQQEAVRTESSQTETVQMEAVQTETVQMEAVQTETPQTELEETEASPLSLWEYEGYVDECIGYIGREEFLGKDFDGDGKPDRLYRTYDADRQIAEYTIEFGNGRKLHVPEGWNTGFPHIQLGDTDGDGEQEVLFTLTYDTSTDPMAFGDMWLFGYDEADGEYRQIALPLVTGENGAKMVTVFYDKPQGNVVTVKVDQVGFTENVTLEEDYLQYWWQQDALTEDEMVYHADLVKDGDRAVLRCYVEIFTRGHISAGFDLVYRDGGYQMENMAFGVYPKSWQ